MVQTTETLERLSGEAKRSYVREMFGAIAPRYDLLNHLLSMNIDRRWRRRAVQRLGWQKADRGVYLDLCAGTLDLAAHLAGQSGFHGQVVGADFALPMLRRGRGKADRLAAVGADALELPFPDQSFEGCVIGFGIRNLTDLDRGLNEMARVLKPGGRLVILEFAQPRSWPVRPLYLTYFRHLLPLIGRMVSGHATAYAYLPDSVSRFPTPERLARSVSDAGFQHVGFELLALGIAAIHWGQRS